MCVCVECGLSDVGFVGKADDLLDGRLIFDEGLLSLYSEHIYSNF